MPGPVKQTAAKTRTPPEMAVSLMLLHFDTHSVNSLKSIPAAKMQGAWMAQKSKVSFSGIVFLSPLGKPEGVVDKA